MSTPAAAPAEPHEPAKCRSCGLPEIDTDESGSLVCLVCGTVYQEMNHIVSELAFTETAKGGAAVFGQFVSSTATPFRRLPGWSRESREITMQQGRKLIQQIAGKVDLKNVHISAAMRVFQLAVQKNFIQGRRTKNIDADVYVLGATFLKLVRAIKLTVALVDPALFIQRFATRLQFEEKTQAVAATALKVVCRMNRDWIQMGRRPAGLCGAALLLAARLHGFKRTQREVVEVVKVCDITLRNRLKEFMDTPTSELTVEEFRNLDADGNPDGEDGLDEEPPCDPPAFTRSVVKGAKTAGVELVIEWNQIAEEAERTVRETPALRELQEEVDPDFALTQATPAAGNEVQDAAAEAAAMACAPSALDQAELSDLDSDEAVEFILTNQKLLEHKKRIWMQLNKEWLDLQEKKEQERAAKMRGTVEEERANAEKKRRRNKRRRDDRVDEAGFDGDADAAADGPRRTAAEAATTALTRKSAKVDYSRLKNLFDDDEAASLAEGGDAAAPPLETPDDAFDVAADDATQLSLASALRMDPLDDDDDEDLDDDE